jgi:hypothetical protein
MWFIDIILALMVVVKCIQPLFNAKQCNPPIKSSIHDEGSLTEGQTSKQAQYRSYINFHTASTKVLFSPVGLRFVWIPETFTIFFFVLKYIPVDKTPSAYAQT